MFRTCSLLLAWSLAGGVVAQQVPVPAARIATGESLWVDSSPNDKLLNARVDLGKLQQIGDEIEFSLQWPVSPGFLSDIRINEPALKIPQGSVLIDRERAVCKPDGMLSYAVATTVVAPDGAPIRARKFDSAGERSRVEGRGFDRYGPNPRSLVCWAAARKCEGTPFTWPPPPNMTPLEHSARATAMRAAYDRQFVPGCKL